MESLAMKVADMLAKVCDAMGPELGFMVQY